MRQPKTPVVPTTYRDSGVVHEVRQVTNAGWSSVAGKNRWSFRTVCGFWRVVDDDRSFKTGRPVGCLACISGDGLFFLDELRGVTADHVIYDEVHNFDIEKE